MVKIGDTYFEVKVIRKNIKNIYLRIRNNALEVTCPKWLSKDQIIKFIESKSSWITATISKREVKNQTSKLVVNDYIYYLGDKYKLNVTYGNPRVSINGDTLTIYSRKDDMEEVLKVFYKEGKKTLLALIREKEDKYLNIIYDYGYHSRPEYKFRVLKSAWGINYPKKNLISINERLIHFDERCLEAVLWHEILHFIIPNHSKRFHQILEIHMPDYEQIIKSIY